MNETAREIYNSVKERMEHWCESREDTDKSFEDQIEYHVFENYTLELYLDNDEFPNTREVAFDLLDILRAMSKLYEEHGATLVAHEYDNNKIVNAFALLCAEHIEEKMIEEYGTSSQQ